MVERCIMSKVFSNILFSLFLLLQNSAIADENETNGTQTEVIQEKQKLQEPKKELSEAQKEAIAAEEAELRESGMEPEPIPE